MRSHLRTSVAAQLQRANGKLENLYGQLASGAPRMPDGWRFGKGTRGNWLQSPPNIAGLVQVLRAVIVAPRSAADMERLFVEHANGMVNQINDVWPSAKLPAVTTRNRKVREALLKYVGVVQMRVSIPQRAGGGGHHSRAEWLWFGDPGPQWTDEQILGVQHDLERTLNQPAASAVTGNAKAEDMGLLKDSLPVNMRHLVDMLVTSCVGVPGASELGIAPGRARTAERGYALLVNETLPALKMQAAADVAAASSAVHKTLATRARFKVLVEKQRVYKNEELAACVARRDILAQHPEIIDVMRQAASELGCKSKAGAGMGTPVDASIFEVGRRGGGSDFNRLLLMVNAYLATHSMSISRR